MTIGIKVQREMKTQHGVPTVAEIRDMVITREDAQNRALIAIYNGQTFAEKDCRATTEDNGIGFTGVDAEILTSFAEQFLSRQYLSPKQRAILVKKMPKYAGQLWQIAVSKKGATLKATPVRNEQHDEMDANRKACDEQVAELNKEIEALEAEQNNADKARSLMLQVKIVSLYEEIALLNEAAYC
jgi:predicted ribosome quality control (RQC) complex YloA/Tae2 family protein